VGTPFWLLKQAFWEGPKKLFSGDKPEKKPVSEPAYVE
jgi:hypothetical protein